ncbi:ABC transporter ATP-binding protein [Ruminiclostridium cellobioparum]|uniref:ABC-type multidrug transport system, ATPase component n=1 Tax=Ruminiclostridium cellobioparum subsp. termitidis CT1112 TaxID=1195236 RepID=S0FP29_RUMCE|nr:ABC transporter ATP-binding protein [Ruminiclostridium cellobioparum]EMS70223.1 ABC-type multidrug transport system, ATPase component [Ruminiclostridium cellobioparum subsp. termitidis CT1112]
MIVEIKDVIKRYGDRIAVDNMSMNVREGEILGLLGPNGAGKTTLINSIIGITGINSGEIKIFDQVMSQNNYYVKKNIGVVPQNLAIYNEFKAYENVEYFGRLYGLKGRELKDSIRQALDFTGLWERKNEYPKKFSGGMQRRLNIACSIVHRPKLIIMDEPTVGIDPQSRNHILDSVVKLNEMGSTVIYTSHYMEEVEALCSRVVIIDNGRLIAQGTIEELKEYIQDEQIIDIVLKNYSHSITEAVKAVYGVKECLLQEGRMKVILDKSSSLARIINSIVENGGIITKINMEDASLEDVFLGLTGKKLRD